MLDGKEWMLIGIDLCRVFDELHVQWEVYVFQEKIPGGLELRERESRERKREKVMCHVI